MKVDLMYSIHYIEHPWDEEMRKQGYKAFVLCREIRLPIEEGHVRGARVSWEPVALFNRDSEGVLFEQFCYAEVLPGVIEVRQEFAEMKREIEQIRSDRRNGVG